MKYNKNIVGKYNENDIVSHNIKFNNGFEVEVLNLGGIITKIITPDKDGNLENIVVGYKNIESYVDNPSYLGAIIGRTSGRVCNGKVKVENKDYDLALNYNPHHGHGGSVGFSKKIWDVNVSKNYSTDNNSIILKMNAISSHLDENYPGNLEVKVSYKISENHTIEIVYEAKCDQTTLVNLTNHSYFNLSGNLKHPITDHYLQIDSDSILEMDETYAVTSKDISVENTPFDFRKLKNIGNDIKNNHYQIEIGNGYDHTFLLNDNNSIYYEDKESKRYMKVSTDQEAVVVYTMNYADDEVLYNNKTNQKRHGICFETQAPPIGKDMCFIEKSILNKDDIYKQNTILSFGTIK